MPERAFPPLWTVEDLARALSSRTAQGRSSATPDEALKIWAVDKMVGNVRNKGPQKRIAFFPERAGYRCALARDWPLVAAPGGPGSQNSVKSLTVFDRPSVGEQF